MLRFTSLASGSGGNATLVEARNEGCAAGGSQRTTRVLVDCGLAPRRLAAALALRGCTAADLDAVFVTHEHGDHIGGVIALHRRHGTPVWASRGTWATVAAPDDESQRCVANLACHGERIAIGALELLPFAVPHDAAEPLQLVCRSGSARIGIVTDLGEPTDGVARALQGCDALLLECNHDRAMLAAGPYPIWLQRRIGGARGHLANEQSTALLAACLHDGLRHVVAAHLSRHNNQPDRALGALRRALPQQPSLFDPLLHVADANTGCGWISVR
jgi:phosphoribosyl 1,2-cyclic phosphodiesterase